MEWSALSGVLRSEGSVEPGGRADEGFREAALLCLDGLFGFALSLARDRSTAEDLVQETYLRALSARHRAEPTQNLRGWLFTILHNIWRNEVRRRRLEPLADGERETRAADVVWLSRAADPERELEQGRLFAELRDAIEGLPEHFRAVVVLRGIEGFSYQEIASILGCPTGTVMSRLARGRALVRQRLAAPPSRLAREGGP